MASSKAESRVNYGLTTAEREERKKHRAERIEKRFAIEAKEKGFNKVVKAANFDVSMEIII